MAVAVPADDQHTRSWEVIACPQEIPRWRREVAAVVRAWGAARGAEYAIELGVWELLSNVLKHVDDRRCRLEVRRVGTAVFAFVDDRSPAPPLVARPDWSATEGRGLWLLNEWASAFGWTPTAEGKRAWFLCAPRAEGDR